MRQQLAERVRLLQSQHKLVSDFGSETLALFVIARLAISDFEKLAGAKWFESPYLHKAAVETVTYVMNQVKPDGEFERPKSLKDIDAISPRPLDILSGAHATVALFNVLQSPGTVFSGHDPVIDRIVNPDSLVFYPQLKMMLGDLSARLEARFGRTSGFYAGMASLVRDYVKKSEDEK